MEEGGGWDVMVCDVTLQIKIPLSNTPARLKYVSEERETGLTSQY